MGGPAILFRTKPTAAGLVKEHELTTIPLEYMLLALYSPYVHPVTSALTRYLSLERTTPFCVNRPNSPTGASRIAPNPAEILLALFSLC